MAGVYFTVVHDMVNIILPCLFEFSKPCNLNSLHNFENFSWRKVESSLSIQESFAFMSCTNSSIYLINYSFKLKFNS